MRSVWLISLLFPVLLGAQDKLFYASGKVETGKLIALSPDVLYFTFKDSSRAVAIPMQNVVLIERENGELILAGRETHRPSGMHSLKDTSDQAQQEFGIQPIGIFAGRFTLVYERFLNTGKIGLVIPISLSFDPFGVFYTSAADTSADSPQHIPGVGYIAGIDMNYYFKEKNNIRYFMGPRFRTGTDKLLRGIEGFTLQFQLGLHYQSGKRMSQHLSFGYGFAKLLNVPASSTLNPEQLYGWISLNYRIGWMW